MAVHVLAVLLPFLVMGDVSVARNGGIDDREKEMIPGREQKEMVLEHQEESLHALIGQ